jgi:hypothetical protein
MEHGTALLLYSTALPNVPYYSSVQVMATVWRASVLWLVCSIMVYGGVQSL